MLPGDVLVVVLLLFQLEDVLDEELLKVFVGEVDAELEIVLCGWIGSFLGIAQFFRLD